MNAGQGEDGAGLGGVSLKSVNPSPPRPAPWCGSKISPHPRPTTFTGQGKSARGEVGKGGSSGAGRGKIAIPNYDTNYMRFFFFHFFFFSTQMHFD